MTNKSIRDYINLIENAQREDMAEGAKWRKHPDAYNVDDEGNKTPRNPNSSKFGYDPLQRRADTANDAKTPRGKTAALKTSLKMAKGNKGVAEGFNGAVSFREMIDVVDQHYPKYYAELSGSDISDKQFERAIVNAYKEIIKKQGVAEGLSSDLKQLIQQYEDMVENVYGMVPGPKKRRAIEQRDALEAQIEALPGGKEALSKWARAYNDGIDEGVAEGYSTMWEVSFDYGPHMSETVKVKAGSEEEAIAKVEKAAEKRGRSIMVNWAKPAEQGVAEGVDIVGQDSDLDQQVFTLNVDGKTVSFTYWDYENNFQSPDIKDIYQQAREQLGKKLSPEQIKAVARSVFKSFKSGVAEGLGLYGPFTVTISTGERPQSRTKTKKFRREDDAILWAQDWLEDFPQYSFATAEVTDPEGNVVWTTDEQGVAEGSEQVYNILALDKGNALKKPTKLKWKANSLEDIFDALAAQDWYPLEINGVEVIAGKRLKKSEDEEQLEETGPEAIAKINELTRRP